MLNTKDCRAILNKNEEKYSEEEIIKIREFLYKMAKIIINQNPKVRKDEK